MSKQTSTLALFFDVVENRKAIINSVKEPYYGFDTLWPTFCRNQAVTICSDYCWDGNTAEAENFPNVSGRFGEHVDNIAGVKRACIYWHSCDYAYYLAISFVEDFVPKNFSLTTTVSSYGECYSFDASLLTEVPVDYPNEAIGEDYVYHFRLFGEGDAEWQSGEVIQLQFNGIQDK